MAADWLDFTPELGETPREPSMHGYMLAAVKDGLFRQEIELTPAEYLSLKKHLAGLRGIHPGGGAGE